MSFSFLTIHDALTGALTSQHHNSHTLPRIHPNSTSAENVNEMWKNEYQSFSESSPLFTPTGFTYPGSTSPLLSASTTAIKEGRIFSVNLDPMEGSADSAIAVRELAKFLHPDKFE